MDFSIDFEWSLQVATVYPWLLSWPTRLLCWVQLYQSPASVLMRQLIRLADPIESEWRDNAEFPIPGNWLMDRACRTLINFYRPCIHRGEHFPSPAIHPPTATSATSIFVLLMSRFNCHCLYNVGSSPFVPLSIQNCDNHTVPMSPRHTQDTQQQQIGPVHKLSHLYRFPFN